MKKIKYFDNCTTVYLETLGLRNKKGYNTRLHTDLNIKWNSIREAHILLERLPKDVEMLIISPYEKFVNYFITLSKIDDNELGQIRNSFDNDKNTIFKYDVFKDKIAKFFIDNANKMNICSCYYCDAAYTGSYRKINSKVGRTFDVDHFFPNAQFPMFSLSLYNFVPSCQVCNSRVKGRTDFFKFYKLNINDVSLKEQLLKISPASKKYDFENSVLIRVLPQKNGDNKWHYPPDFLKNIESYKVHFDLDKESAYSKVVDAMRLQERYNNIAIKSHALYLANLRKKCTDSYIHFISEIFRKSKMPISEEQIRETIFHKNDKYALLKKMRYDIIEITNFEK